MNTDMDNSDGFRNPKTWTDFSYLRWKQKEPKINRINKILLKNRLAEIGISCAKKIAEFDSASEITLSGLPEAFVLKPSSLWSATGVMLLHRVYGTNLYFNAMTRSVISESRIIESQKNLEVKLKKQIKFIVEERVFDENIDNIIPLDYKVFSFNGVNKFVLQVDRNHQKPKLFFYDGLFEPITDERVVIPSFKAETIGHQSKPRCYAQILQSASEISRKFAYPFVSVDCYATNNGAVIGELTSTPGGPWYGSMYRFSDEFDELLGNAWLEASKQLKLEYPKVPLKYDICKDSKICRQVG